MSKEKNRLYRSVILWIAIMFAIVALGVVSLTLYLESEEESKVARLIEDSKAKLRETIQAPFYRNYSLNSFIISANGDYNTLSTDVKTLFLPSTRFIGIAKDGQVSEIYPTEEGEKISNYKIEKNGVYSIGDEIISTSPLTLTLTGPCKVNVGNATIVSWLPIYLDAGKNDDNFWGFTFVGVDLLKVIEQTGVRETINLNGYDFTINSYGQDGKECFFTDEINEEGAKYLETELELTNNPIYLRIYIPSNWSSYGEVWILIVIGLIILLSGCIVIPQNLKLKAQKELLESQLVRDVLTGILNRRGLGIEIERLIRLDKKFVTYFLDLDHFKAINDKYGHDVGDEVLRLFTYLVDKQLDGSHIFARNGGDEFILIHVVNGDDGEALMDEFFERIHEDLIKSPITVGRKKFTVSFSWGSARFPEDGATFADVLKKADMEMYKNKKHTY